MEQAWVAEQQQEGEWRLEEEWRLEGERRLEAGAAEWLEERLRGRVQRGQD